MSSGRRSIIENQNKKRKPNNPSDDESTEDHEKKKIFNGLLICVAGKLSKSRNFLSEYITKHGGTFTKNVTKRVFLNFLNFSLHSLLHPKKEQKVQKIQ